MGVLRTQRECQVPQEIDKLLVAQLPLRQPQLRMRIESGRLLAWSVEGCASATPACTPREGARPRAACLVCKSVQKRAALAQAKLHPAAAAPMWPGDRRACTFKLPYALVCAPLCTAHFQSPACYSTLCPALPAADYTVLWSRWGCSHSAAPPIYPLRPVEICRE